MSDDRPDEPGLMERLFPSPYEGDPIVERLRDAAGTEGAVPISSIRRGREVLELAVPLGLSCSRDEDGWTVSCGELGLDGAAGTLTRALDDFAKGFMSSVEMFYDDDLRGTEVWCDYHRHITGETVEPDRAED